MYILPLYFCLFSFLFTLSGGRLIGIRGACFVTTFFVGLSFLSSLYIYSNISLNEVISYIDMTEWASFDLVNIKWLFYFDNLTANMLLVVTFVSFCAHFYSIDYMNGDPHQVRFMSYLSLFTFFMLMLITAGNLVQLFVGWEGVGICSYLLINFWYTRLKANKAAIMAVITNKIGDITLLLAFGLIFFIYKSFDFNLLFSYVSFLFIFDMHYLSFINDVNYIICFLFILGAVGKSAQVGLHIWLPEAMEGPTPVSSLIHAATMVTAGIFLILRCSFLFESIPTVLLWIIFFGSVTTFFASSVGLFQNDLKKIVAYSTCSQLGYMFLACGLSGYNYSMFHLFNHAFFKALLFLTAGYIIHSISNEQDIRKMGGLIKLFPFSYIMMLIASLSLMGLPFFSGFYSKEKIIELFNNRFSFDILDISYYNLYFFFQFISTLAVVCTILYSVRLIIYVFFNFFNGFYYYLTNLNIKYTQLFSRVSTETGNKLFNLQNIHYGSFYLMFPLVLLCILSVSSGFLFKDLMIGEGLLYWNSSVYFHYLYQNNVPLFYLVNYEFNEYLRGITFFWVCYFTISFFIVSMLFRIFFYYLTVSSSYFFFIFRTLVEKYIYFNTLIIDGPSILIFYVSYYITYLLIDKGFIEVLGPYGIFNVVRNAVLRIKLLEKYSVTHYLFYFFLAYSFLLLFIL